MAISYVPYEVIHLSCEASKRKLQSTRLSRLSLKPISLPPNLLCPLYFLFLSLSATIISVPLKVVCPLVFLLLVTSSRVLGSPP
jgi:hypothetical protein